jgi:hypothetical protein
VEYDSNMCRFRGDVDSGKSTLHLIGMIICINVGQYVQVP